MAVSRRERIAVAAAVGVALLVGVPGLLLDTGAAKARSLSAEKAKRRDVQAKLASTRTELEQLEGEVGKQVLPGSERDVVPRIVLAAQAAAKTAGLRLTDIKPLPAEDVSGLKRVPVQISASAQFGQGARFLYELEEHNRRYRVDQLRVIRAASSKGDLQIELRVVAFVNGDQEGRDAETKG